MNAAQTSRSPSRGAEIANILLGIWVALSPFVIGFNQNVAGKWSNIAVGIALVLVALASTWGDEAFEGLVVPLGIWLFASPFVLGFSRWGFLVNNLIMAFIVIAAGAISDGLRSPAGGENKVSP
jgi:hypothetical protein